MKEISKAIVKVMQEVKGMEKNSQVGSGSYGYSGTKDQDVKEVFNDALANNGLSILPIEVKAKTQVDRWQEGTKTKQSVFTEVETKYLLLHTSGESIELAGYGHGVDAQDKGAGKATTYALKNCLLYTFLTPVGKIDDSDTTHSNDIKTPQKEVYTINDAINEIKAAVNVELVTSLWSKGKAFQKDPKFIAAVKEQGEKLKA